MAKAWKVNGLRGQMSVRDIGRRVLAVRIAEFYSFAPFIHDPGRVTELHDMRIAAKRLRYTLEIFLATLPESGESLLEQVREIQECLGDIHDADVLADTLTDRLTEIAREDQAALIERLHIESDEENRLTTITAHLTPSGRDRRIGIYALLGRTLHRRRQRYADYLDLWATLEARDFRAQLEALTRRSPAAIPVLADDETLAAPAGPISAEPATIESP